MKEFESSTFENHHWGFAFGSLLLMSCFAGALWMAETRKELSDWLITSEEAIANSKTRSALQAGPMNFASGEVYSKESLKDQKYIKLSFNAISLQRHEEVFAWIEERASAQLAAQKKGKLPVVYRKGWTSQVQDSRKFLEPTGRQNPTEQTDNRKWTAQQLMVGKWMISTEGLILPEGRAYTIDPEELKNSNCSQCFLKENTLYMPIGKTVPLSPEIGDRRIRYTVLERIDMGTLFGMYDGSQWRPYPLPDGNLYFRLMVGNKSAAIESLGQTWNTIKWVMRGISFVVMVLALQLSSSFFLVLGQWMPILSKGTGGKTLFSSSLMAAFVTVSSSMAMQMGYTVLIVPCIIVVSLGLLFIFWRWKSGSQSASAESEWSAPVKASSISRPMRPLFPDGKTATWLKGVLKKPIAPQHQRGKIWKVIIALFILVLIGMSFLFWPELTSELILSSDGLAELKNGNLREFSIQYGPVVLLITALALFIIVAVFRAMSARRKASWEIKEAFPPPQAIPLKNQATSPAKPVGIVAAKKNLVIPAKSLNSPGPTGKAPAAPAAPPAKAQRFAGVVEKTISMIRDKFLHPVNQKPGPSIPAPPKDGISLPGFSKQAPKEESSEPKLYASPLRAQAQKIDPPTVTVPVPVRQSAAPLKPAPIKVQDINPAPLAQVDGPKVDKAIVQPQDVIQRPAIKPSRRPVPPLNSVLSNAPAPVSPAQKGSLGPLNLPNASPQKLERWFVLAGEFKYGPFTIFELNQFYSEGRITAETLCRQSEGAQQIIRLDQIIQIKPINRAG